MADTEVRAASLQAAVKFAERWGLDGVVLACEVWMEAPRLVRWVKGRGLVVGSYGGGCSTVEGVRVSFHFSFPF